jgi:UDPglucose--hexose-1-phosphate uridylyltransferase
VRVVPNRFAVLSEDGPPTRIRTPQGFVSTPGVGHHEVVIESRKHDADLSLVSADQVRAVVEAYRARYRGLSTEPGGVVVIFRNHGAGAGTSQTHPHSQIIATPVVPIHIRHRYDVAIHTTTTAARAVRDVRAAESPMADAWAREVNVSSFPAVCVNGAARDHAAFARRPSGGRRP